MSEERQLHEIFVNNVEAGEIFQLNYDELVKQSQLINFPIVDLFFKKNSYFTGREEQLTQINDYLSQQNNLAITNSINESVAQAIAGLGGVGKSQLAIEYAYRALKKKSYQIIWFINGQNLDVDYLRLAASLKIYGEDKDDIITKTKRKLEELGDYLLIIDNAENYEAIKNYLPQTGNNGHVLITTRCRLNWIKMLELGVFSLDEALDYFEKITGFKEEEKEDVVKLVGKLLGFLPLALTQAGAFIKQTGMTVKDYITFFETKLTELWEAEDKARDYSQTIAVTWEITVNCIKQKYPQVEELLRGMSCLACMPNKIDQSWLSVFLEDEIVRVSLLGELAAYSIIEKYQEVNQFTVHSLVQEGVLLKLTYEEQRTFIVKIFPVLNEIFPSSTTPNIEMLNKQKLSLPHLECLLKISNDCFLNISHAPWKEELEKEIIDRLLVVAASGYRSLGNAKRSKDFFEKSLVIRKKYYDKNHIDVAITLVNLGNAHGEIGRAHV